MQDFTRDDIEALQLAVDPFMLHCALQDAARNRNADGWLEHLPPQDGDAPPAPTARATYVGSGEERKVANVVLSLDGYELGVGRFVDNARVYLGARRLLEALAASSIPADGGWQFMLHVEKAGGVRLALYVHAQPQPQPGDG